jgi:DNA-binding winged helix-turn-helix (wHTH) protein/TolB-like protein/Tfp pilus assembly protein PilF
LKQPLPDDFSIGGWKVFPASNELCRQDERIPLEPKVMALLLYLAQHAGRTVTRDQLFEALWPGLVVSDDTLTQAVIKLRKALGDSAKEARYIQTIPKRGYRLNAVVDFDEPENPAQSSGPMPWPDYATVLLIVLVIGVPALYFAVEMAGRHESAGLAIDEHRPDGPPTLSVQPFELLGDDASQAYLAQGLTYDLITDLSKLSGLWVIGSRSILGQTGDQPSTTSARYLVSGDVQRIGDRIRIHVHLVDVLSGHQIWSERFHRSVDSLFQLQEEISRNIASSLSLKVNEAEHRRLAHRYTRNLQAYDQFLQAQSRLLVRQKAENGIARQHYRQAITLDPSFARAYAGLALSFAADFRNQWVSDGTHALEQAREMAHTALQIDAEIPEVYWVLAYVNAQQRQHKKALKLLRKAISLDQSFADAYALMGGINTYLGHSAETPALIRSAIRLNPEAGYLYYLLLGRAYFFLGEWEQAQINLHEALTRNPANLEAHLYLAASMVSVGDHEGATWETQEVLSLRPGFDVGSWLKTYPMTDAAQVQRLQAALVAAGLDGE